jgi:DNA-binding NtrC family response regulator
MSATLASGLPDHTLSANMQRVYENGIRAASSGANILILGEEGAGKEVLARWLHAVSPRARKPLLAVNCAALPESCIDEELCGSRLAGARVPQGCLERADGGAILLDEIGEMEIEPLRKLRAALAAHSVLPVGGNQRVPADVQFFSISSRDLEAEIAAGWRSLEYLEIAEVTLLVPPLRERRSEIRALARQFLARQRAQDGRPSVDIPEDVMTKLESYSWPGNVRDLWVHMCRAAILCEGTAIGLEHLSNHVAGR